MEFSSGIKSHQQNVSDCTEKPPSNLLLWATHAFLQALKQFPKLAGNPICGGWEIIYLESKVNGMQATDKIITLKRPRLEIALIFFFFGGGGVLFFFQEKHLSFVLLEDRLDLAFSFRKELCTLVNHPILAKSGGLYGLYIMFTSMFPNCSMHSQ